MEQGSGEASRGSSRGKVAIATVIDVIQYQANAQSI